MSKKLGTIEDHNLEKLHILRNFSYRNIQDIITFKSLYQKQEIGNYESDIGILERTEAVNQTCSVKKVFLEILSMTSFWCFYC